VGRRSGATTDRERALDALRAIALIRVVLWHTYGIAAMTYIIAAVPTMFFVTGSLFAKSAERRPVGEVVRNRVRRIFVPLWAFSAVCLLAMSVAHRVDRTEATTVPWRGMWLWFVPLAMWATPGQSNGHAWRIVLGLSVWIFVLVASSRPRWPVRPFRRHPEALPTS